MENLSFTSYVASNLKDLFDEKFANYKHSLSEMSAIAPQVISTTLESTVNKFFTSIDSQIATVEQSVLSKIHQSTNLRQLEELLNTSKEGFGLDLEKLYDENRQEIDGFVNKGCYSTVVSKKDKYEELIQKMLSNNDSMKGTVESG
jgi:hypothetical protein